MKFVYILLDLPDLYTVGWYYIHNKLLKKSIKKNKLGKFDKWTKKKKKEEQSFFVELK